MKTLIALGLTGYLLVSCTPSQLSQPTARAPEARTHEVKSPHLALGTPTDSDFSDDIVLDEGQFVLSYNAARRVPNWVSWRLTSSDLGNVDRADKFHPDSLLPAGVTPVVKADYANSGFDMGHMCPSAQRTSSEDANYATFVLTNIQPQMHGLNAGPWKSLETYERALAQDSTKEVYVVAGGVFNASPKKLASSIAVPNGNYRITVVLEHGQTARNVSTATPIYAVIMPNSPDAKGHEWTDFMVSVDSIEQKTGYDFLSSVRDDIENAIEAKVPPPPQ